jgi:hypothetical protein
LWWSINKFKFLIFVKRILIVAEFFFKLIVKQRIVEQQQSIIIKLYDSTTLLFD